MNPQSVWQQMRNIFEFVEQQLAKDLNQKYGIGLTEYRALQLLAEAPKLELRMQELATQLGLNQSSVTRLIERVERSEYTIRDVCPNDKRGVYAVITQLGLQIQADIRGDYEHFLTLALDKIISRPENQPIADRFRKLVFESAN